MCVFLMFGFEKAVMEEYFLGWRKAGIAFMDLFFYWFPQLGDISWHSGILSAFEIDGFFFVS